MSKLSLPNIKLERWRTRGRRKSLTKIKRRIAIARRIPVCPIRRKHPKAAFRKLAVSFLQPKVLPYYHRLLLFGLFCYITVTTIAGVEMSSDDDTPSLSEEDKQQHQQQPNRMESQPFTVNSKDITYSSSNTNVRQRFRVTSQKSSSPLKEGSFSSEFLENIQKIGKCPSATRRTDVINDEEAIESGVDALADLNISNFRIDSDNVLNIDEVSGTDIRNAEFGRDGFYDDLETVYAPSGFVDLRRSESSHMNWYQFGYKCVHTHVADR